MTSVFLWCGLEICKHEVKDKTFVDLLVLTVGIWKLLREDVTLREVIFLRKFGDESLLLEWMQQSGFVTLIFNHPHQPPRSSLQISVQIWKLT